MADLCGMGHPERHGVTCTNKPHPWGYHLDLSNPAVPIRWEGSPRPTTQTGEKPFPAKTKREGRSGPPSVAEIYPSRHTDPSTSSTQVITLAELRASQQEVLDLFDRAMTDEEMICCADENGVVQASSGLRTRRSELVSAGLLRDSGRRGLTENNRPSIIWERVSDS